MNSARLLYSRRYGVVDVLTERTQNEMYSIQYDNDELHTTLLVNETLHRVFFFLHCSENTFIVYCNNTVILVKYRNVLITLQSISGRHLSRFRTTIFDSTAEEKMMLIWKEKFSFVISRERFHFAVAALIDYKQNSVQGWAKWKSHVTRIAKFLNR